MAHRLATPEGRQVYASRKQTPEPVFGIIKSVMGFRQSHLRGLEKVKGEWNMVTLAWNMKRMFALPHPLFFKRSPETMKSSRSNVCPVHFACLSPTGC